jgi:hypothetical protein
MEAWAAASARAEKALQQKQDKKQKPADVMEAVMGKGRSKSMPPPSTAVSMDDDGGGSETNWRAEEVKSTDRPKIAKNLWDDDLYNNIPVGIREFMKHEKKLKEKHEREGTFGA